MPGTTVTEMAIATNDENVLATSAQSQGSKFAETASTNSSANRKVRQQVAPVTSSPAENIVAQYSESTSSTTGARPANKTRVLINLLRRTDGASLSEISTATGWQAHSVRGFLSATVRKKLGLNLISNISGEGVRRYTIDDSEPLAETARPIDLPPFGSFKGARDRAS
jgi:hypothetical protein